MTGVTTVGPTLRARLARAVAAARERAAALGRPVLAAVSEEVPGLEPLALFEAAAGEERFYWRQGRAAFAGAGAAAEWTDTELPAIETAWHRLLAEAVLDGDGRAPEPRLVGGARFERERPYDPLWEDLPATWFFLPEALVEGPGDGPGRLTVCTVVGAVTDLEARVAAVTERITERVAPQAGRTAPRSPAPRPAQRPAASMAGGEAGPGALGFRYHPDRDGWRRAVLDALGAIAAEELDKVVLARQVRLRAAEPFDAGRALRRLAATYPDCTLFAVGRGESVFLGATPERLARLAGRRIEAASLAGTAPRGDDDEADRARAAGLLASSKERWEHTLVVQAVRQVLEATCAGVTAPAEPSLLTLANLHHLHTPLAAELAPGRSFLEVAAALHPSPAVGGYPRQRARDFLRRHEAIDRGWYAAPVGWLDGEGSAELAVALRSGLLRGREATLFAGCGIVAGSEPEAEWRESELKLAPMLEALTGER